MTTTTTQRKPRRGSLANPIAFSATLPPPLALPVGEDLDAPGAFTEEKMWARNMRARQQILALTDPLTYKRYPLGTWAGGELVMGELWQLRRFRLDDKRLWWKECEPTATDLQLWGMGKNVDIINHYADWIRRGFAPPPGLGYELESRRIAVSEGHHRGCALWRTGQTHVLLWVSPLHAPVSAPEARQSA